MEERPEDTHKYDDIIDLPYHSSPNRQHMPVSDRAAQFSPFAALSGYESAVWEAMRLTDSQIDMDEDMRTILDRKLALLMECPGGQPEVAVTFFKPDEKKEGGAYQAVRGRVRKIDSYERRLVMEDGMTLPMEWIVQIDSEIF